VAEWLTHSPAALDVTDSRPNSGDFSEIYFLESIQSPAQSSVFPVFLNISVTIIVTINGTLFPLPFWFRYYKYFRYYYNYVIVFPLSFPLPLITVNQ